MKLKCLRGPRLSVLAVGLASVFALPAAQAFSLAHELAPDDRVTSELLRCAVEFAQISPPADWEAILILETK